MAMTQLLSEPDAAQALGVSPRTLRKLRAEGKIRYVAVTARSIKYRQKDLEAFTEARATVAQPGNETKPPAPKRTGARAGTVVPFTQRHRAR